MVTIYPQHYRWRHSWRSIYLRRFTNLPDADAVQDRLRLVVQPCMPAASTLVNASWRPPTIVPTSTVKPIQVAGILHRLANRFVGPSSIQVITLGEPSYRPDHPRPFLFVSTAGYADTGRALFDQVATFVAQIYPQVWQLTPLYESYRRGYSPIQVTTRDAALKTGGFYTREPFVATIHFS